MCCLGTVVVGCQWGGKEAELRREQYQLTSSSLSHHWHGRQNCVEHTQYVDLNDLSRCTHYVLVLAHSALVAGDGEDEIERAHAVRLGHSALHALAVSYIRQHNLHIGTERAALGRDQLQLVVTSDEREADGGSGIRVGKMLTHTRRGACDEYVTVRQWQLGLPSAVPLQRIQPGGQQQKKSATQQLYEADENEGRVRAYVSRDIADLVRLSGSVQLEAVLHHTALAVGRHDGKSSNAGCRGAEVT